MDQPLNPIPVLATDSDGNVLMATSPFTGLKLTLTDPNCQRPQIVIIEGDMDKALSFLTDAGFTARLEVKDDQRSVLAGTSFERPVEGGVEVATFESIKEGDTLA